MNKSKNVASQVTQIETQLDFIVWRNLEFEKVNCQFENELPVLKEGISNFVNNQSYSALFIGIDEKVFLIDVLNPWVINLVEKCRNDAESRFNKLLSRYHEYSRFDDVLGLFSSFPFWLRGGLTDKIIGSIPKNVTFDAITTTVVDIFISSSSTLPLDNLRGGALGITGHTGYRILENDIKKLVFGDWQNLNSVCLLNTLQGAIVLAAENNIKGKTFAASV